MSEQGEGPEVVIGAEEPNPARSQRREPDFTLRPSDEIATKPKGGLSRLIEKFKIGAKKGYDYLDAGVTPKEVPLEEITEQKVAEAIKDYRIEVGRFKKYDPEFVEAPFDIPNIMMELGYFGNWQAGTTNWREKHPEVYDRVRRGIDGLVRSGALSTMQGPEKHPDNESVWYKIENEDAIRNASKPAENNTSETK